MAMSESEVGLALTTTRQNAGSVLKNPDKSRPVKFCGGPENVPAATVFADVMLALGSAIAASLAHFSSGPALAPWA